ncbi:hypothetical protein AHF37_01171 [Paragonimus kellicotti]|nr:hypothetical protein AHF37_01171 [Paragonimus kellicotti]
MAANRPEELFHIKEYVSDYESDTSSHIDTRSEISRSELPPLKDPELISKPTRPRFPAYGNSKSVLDQEQRRVHNAAVRHQLLNLNAYDRHRKLVNDYLQYYGGTWSDFKRDESNDRRDIDIVREHGRFLWSEKDEPSNWSERLAKRYWDKLFKEYCLVDLSRFKENKFGMRWRLEKEVISGKGQFTCGSVQCSAGSDSRLRSWEVNFAYKERGEQRNALVKLRLCPDCSEKLNYRHKRRDVTGRSSQSTDSSGQPKTEHSDKSQAEQTDDPGEPSATKRVKRSPTDSMNQTSIWRDPKQCRGAQSNAPKTQEEEFDEYFADMLL